MASEFDPVPLTRASVIPPALGPLANSFDANDSEAAFKAIFLEVFEDMIRPRLLAIETLGLPHRGPLSVVETAVKLEGLAVERVNNDEAFTRELFRSWKARNPRRGLHFLTQYLQMLWPDLWECDQLWQNPAETYPSHAYRKQRGGHYLTSRVLVAVAVDDPTGDSLTKMRGSFRTVLAARFVILMALLRRFHNTVGSGGGVRMANAFLGLQVYGDSSIRLDP